MARLPPSLRGKPLDWGDDEAATRVQRDAASLSLIAREGPLAGRIYGTDGHPITIGRGASCGVHLALSEISRRHAVIRYRAGRYWVEDLQTLNGTRVNQQLIDGPAALHHGDRIHIGAQEFEVRLDIVANREVVYDGPNSEALSVRPAGQATVTNRVGLRPLGPFGFAVVAVLAISTGVLLAFAITRESRRSQARNQPSASVAPPPAATAAPARAPAPPPTPIRARVALDGTVALAAPEAGTVQWAAARGTPVRTGDELVRFRRNNAAKQRELDKINEQLEEDDSNPRLIRRAHALAHELDAPDTASIKSSFDGVVVAAPELRTRVQAGVGEVRVARVVRLVLDASAVNGAGSACRVSFFAQRLAAEGRRVVGGSGATIELTRFPEELSLDDLGRVRADCK